MRISDWSSDVCSSDLLVLADVGHRLMIFGGVIDVAGVDFLLDSADAVEQAGGAGLDPRALKLFVAAIGLETALGHFGQELDRERLIGREVGHSPPLGGVDRKSVG